MANVKRFDEAKLESELKKFERYIVNPPEHSRVFDITPELAAQLLKLYNRNNRPSKPTNIKRYAGDMVAGEWVLTGDSLKFSQDGVLRDGQNRLMACVRAGVPFETHVVFGIDDMSFDRMDRGKVRDASDVLAILGVKNSHTIAAAVAWAHRIEANQVRGRQTLDPRQVRRLFEERYSTLPDFLPMGRRLWKLMGQPPSITTALLYLFHRVDPAKAEAFGEAWASGQWDGKFRAIKLLQTQIASISAMSQRALNDTVRIAMIIKAWNLYLSGRVGRANEISWSLDEEFPQIEGK